jgi:hypothetical protein
LVIKVLTKLFWFKMATMKLYFNWKVNANNLIPQNKGNANILRPITTKSKGRNAFYRYWDVHSLLFYNSTTCSLRLHFCTWQRLLHTFPNYFFCQCADRHILMCNSLHCRAAFLLTNHDLKPSLKNYITSNADF